MRTSRPFPLHRYVSKFVSSSTAGVRQRNLAGGTRALTLTCEGCDGVTQLVPVARVTHVMPMSNEANLSPPSARAGKTARATFGAAETRGPIIDQDGREIREETLGPQSRGFRF